MSVREEFNMLSNARGRGPASPPAAPESDGSSGTGGRAVEQRYAKLVAETEYRLLEERSRAQEREQRLRDEITRERAQMQRTVQERAEQMLREKGYVPASAAQPPSGRQPTENGSGATNAEVDRLRRQLEETKQLLNDAERRYQQEKRELLNMRTAQIKNETAKRGHEGDIVARAMQVMSEYESVVRSSEENSLARLAHHMENFEKEWIRRSREFEERKGDFEATVVARVLETLKQHQKDLESVGRQLLEKSVDLAKSQSDSRMNMEEEILRHSEMFKEQYKEILESEFYQRCREYDEKIAERERSWVNILHEEREKIMAAEQKAVEEHEAIHVKALGDAMKDISQLREQLVQEHQERQKEAMKDIIARRNEMMNEQEEAIAAINERAAEVQQECAKAIENAQKQIKEAHLDMARREADLTKASIEKDRERDKQLLEKINAARKEVEEKWKETVDAIRASHQQEMEELTNEYNDKIATLRQESELNEGESRKKYEQRMVEAEEAAEYRWNTRVQEAMEGLERHMEVIQALREDNEQLSAQLASARQEMELKGVEMEGVLTRNQREQEQMWFKKMEDMRKRYDKLLDEALGDGSDGDDANRNHSGVPRKVTREDYEQLLDECRQWEERCVSIKRVEAERMQTEREELNAIWRKRLEEERNERSQWEEEQLHHVADLRVELLAEVKEKEMELMKRVEDERQQTREDLVRSLAKERETYDALLEKTRADADERVRKAEQGFKDAYEEHMNKLEARVAEKEDAVEQLELELRRERQRAHDEAREKAAAWLAMEKEAFDSNVEAQMARLDEERASLEARKTTLQQQLLVQYSERFEEAKKNMENHLLHVVEAQLQHWQTCERSWLTFRAEDIQIRQQEKRECIEQVEKRAKNAVAAVRKEAEEIVRSEREALDAREATYLSDMEKSRQAAEATARSRALKLIEEQNRIQADAAEKRAKEMAQRWEEVQKTMMEKERQLEAARQAIEQELRSKYDALIASERQRVDAALEQHRQALRDAQRHNEEELLRRDEEWRKRQDDLTAQQLKRQEELLEDLRAESGRRLQDERRRFDAMLAEREKNISEDRNRLFNLVEKQLKEQDSASQAQMSKLQRDYDTSLQTILADSQKHREKYIEDLADQERRHQDLRDEYEKEVTRKFQDSMASMRDALEQKIREQLENEADVQRRLEDQRTALQKKMNQEYEAFVQDQEMKLLKLNEERSKRTAELEKGFQDQLLRLREEMESALSEFCNKHDAESKESAEEARQAFSEKLNAFYQTVEDEREKRMELERKLSELQQELEEARTSAESQKLQAMLDVQEKYDKLYGDVRDKARREKEALAKRSLEDEERRLVKELMQRDSSRSLTANKPRAVADNRAPQSSASPSSGSYGRAPAASTPLSSRLQGGGATSAPAPSGRYTASGLNHSYHGGGTAVPSSAATSSQRGTPLPSRPSTAPSPYSQAATVTDDDVRQQREKLIQLWQVLDVPEEEQQQFLRHLQGAPMNQVAEAMAREIRRFEVQLPLLEVVTRREFVLHRIKELEEEIDEMGNGASDASMARQVDTIEEFHRELRRLTQHLKAEIPKHESKYGSTFVFRGHRYMDVLLRDQ